MSFSDTDVSFCDERSRLSVSGSRTRTRYLVLNNFGTAENNSGICHAAFHFLIDMFLSRKRDISSLTMSDSWKKTSYLVFSLIKFKSWNDISRFLTYTYSFSDEIYRVSVSDSRRWTRYAVVGTQRIHDACVVILFIKWKECISRIKSLLIKFYKIN